MIDNLADIFGSKQIDAILKRVSGPLSVAVVDEIFAGIIKKILGSVTVLLASGGEATAERLNAALGELGSAGIETFGGLLARICREKEIDFIELQTWIGPQGVGKGALGDTLSWSERLFVRKEVPDDFFRFLKDEYELTDERVAELDKLLRRVPQALDDAILSIFRLLANEKSDTIFTGTGGIFHPRGGGGLRERYRPYITQYDVTGVIIKTGAMVDSNWTNFLVILELARSACYADAGEPLSVTVDVWPRTVDQADYLHQHLIPAMREQGVRINHWLMHIEPFDAGTIDAMDRAGERARELYRVLGNLLQEVSRDPTVLGFEPRDFNILQVLGLDGASEEELTGQIEMIKTRGSAAMRRTAIELGARLRKAMAGEIHADDDYTRTIIAGLSDCIKTCLARVANRIESQARLDDLKMATVLFRLGVYYAETGLVALRMGSRLLPAGGRQAADEIGPQYESAINGVVKRLAEILSEGYDPENDTFRAFLKFITQLYLVRVSK
jgi:hypothetical protein